MPDEENDEFKKIVTKLSTSGLGPQDDKFFLNEEPNSDVSIGEWFNEIKSKTDKDKNTKIQREQPNPYRLEPFANHLENLAKEDPLWSPIMRKIFYSPYVRATSCFVDGDFGELKDNVVRKRVHGPVRSDKLFIFHFEALRGQCLIALSAITQARMEQYPVQKNRSKNPALKQLPILDKGKCDIHFSQNNNITELVSFHDNRSETPVQSNSLNDSHVISNKYKFKFLSNTNVPVNLMKPNWELNLREVW